VVTDYFAFFFGIERTQYIPEADPGIYERGTGPFLLFPSFSEIPGLEKGLGIGDNKLFSNVTGRKHIIVSARIILRHSSVV